MSKYDRKYRRIAKQISPLEIQANFSHENLSLDDLFSDNKPSQSSELFLGHYSRDGIELLIQRFGLDKLVRHLGIRQIDLVVNTEDPYRHSLRIYNGTPHVEENLVMDFVARYQLLTPREENEKFIFQDTINVLQVEWLNLQNPTAEFTRRRPRLPGQNFPGLGLGDQLFALFTLMGRHLRVDGILNVPEHYHTGLMFSRRFVFIDPRSQALVHTIAKDLWQRYRLAVIAWACRLGAIVDDVTGKAFQWHPHRQIIPIRPALRSYFKDSSYTDVVKQAAETYHFSLDEEKLRVALAKQDPPPIDF